MTQLRVLHPVTAADDALVAYAEWARAQDGCIEAEPYRRTTGDRRGWLVELWADEPAFTSFWRGVLDGGEGGSLLRDSVSAADAAASEIYHQRSFHKERGWVDDSLPDEGSVIAWPARGAVRVLIVTSVADPDAALTGFGRDEAATRREPGCLEYDWCQSLVDPHHFCLAELWESQPIYDAHWQLRIKVAEAAERRAASPPRRAPGPRSLGANSLEFYRHQPFRHHYDRWLPADVAAWSETVSWGS